MLIELDMHTKCFKSLRNPISEIHHFNAPRSTRQTICGRRLPRHSIEGNVHRSAAGLRLLGAADEQAVVRQLPGDQEQSASNGVLFDIEHQQMSDQRGLPFGRSKHRTARQRVQSDCARTKALSAVGIHLVEEQGIRQ